MPKFTIIFLDNAYDTPQKEIFKNHFENYQSSDWENGASFVFVDDCNNEYSLVISEDINYGFNLIYGSPNINCYSLGNANLLNEFIRNADDMVMPKGTYISSEQAWLATEDFLDNPFIPSTRIKWTTDEHIDWSKANDYNVL